MKKKCATMIYLFFAIFIFQASALADQSGLQIPKQITGERAAEHLQFLTELGPRVAGTMTESDAATYIADQFEAMGYEVTIQDFPAEDSNGNQIFSSNIIATRTGKFDQNVIIGAHYDSILKDDEYWCDDDLEVGTGAGDNASGVAVMLEVAEVLSNYKTKGTITFIAFGAEESGLWGSRYYAENMEEEDIENTAAMINLDSVGAGDYFYVYSGRDGNPGWARDLALKIGQRMGYDLRTSPQSDCFDWGTTGDWSDHRPFRYLGIPVAYFEWMNWDIEPCGGEESGIYEWIMHTCFDNVNFISLEKIEMTADVVGSLVFQLSKNKLPKFEKGKVAKGNKYISIPKRNDLSN